MVALLLLVAAQLPQQGPPPQQRPRPFTPPAAQTAPPTADLYPPADPTVPLPHPESVVKAGPRAFSVRPADGGFALAVGGTPVRAFGSDRVAADDALRAVRGLVDLSDWGTVTGRLPLDYAVLNGRAAPTHASGGRHQGAKPIDLQTVRAEAARGVWLLRDDRSLLVNFGPDRAAAEQSAAVCKRYGFNRLLPVGGTHQPAFRLLFAAPVDERADRPTGDVLTAALTEQGLTRTGVPVPGGGYAGERVVLDPRQVEARRERAGWVLAHGRDVLATFGGDDNGAREAARMVRDAHLTEWCTVGGLTFFLCNGQAPTRVPFVARGTAFRPDQVKAAQADGAWAVTAGGRPLFPATSQAEAEQMAGVVQAFRFDTVCHVGRDPRAGLKFLARTSGR